MSDADESADAAAQHVRALRASSRAKYARGAERLQAGEDILALLRFHGAIEDAVWAYLLSNDTTPGSWSGVIDTLRADPDVPLSDEYATLLRANQQLRSRIAHGEEVVLDSNDVADYQQVAKGILRTYGVVTSEQRITSATPVAAELPLHSESSDSGAGGDADIAAERRPRRRAGRPTDLHAWREQAVAQVQRNRLLLVPIAGVLVVLLLMCMVVRGLFGGSTAAPASQDGRPTLALSTPSNSAATAPTGATSLANEQATILPTANGSGPSVPAVEGVPPSASALAVGGRAVVNQQGDQLNLRTEPNTGANSAVIASLAAGTSLQVLEGPTEAEGRTWWRVRADSLEGWCVGDFLSAQAGP